ncbi:MAG TPA: TIGR00725 family protein [Anaeromyxobacter sp.]
MATSPFLIAVIGDGTVPEGTPPYALAERLGEALVDAGFRVLTGGLDGIMEAASRGASRSRAHGPGSVIGLLPGHDPADANPWVDVPLATGLGHARNPIVAHASAVIAIGGGAGTLSELAFAWILRRLVIAFRVPGWSGRLAGTRIDDRVRFRSIPDDQVWGVDTAEEAVQILRLELEAYEAARREDP